ncbi:MAG: NDP-sugar synthase [Thermostichus sp. BF3_bins_97]
MRGRIGFEVAMQAVILAGGKGTRLRPFTLLQPKPLMPLLEVPFLEWMIGRCRRVGLTDILLSVGYLGRQIESALGDGGTLGVKIRYISEETPLDTAGALVLAQPYFSGDPLVVFNADILTDLDLRALMQCHEQSKAAATLTLTRVEDITAYGLVEVGAGGQIRSFREKPTAAEALTLTTDTINAGTYVLDPAIFRNYPSGDPLSFERRVFPDLLNQGQRMQAYLHEGYWRDLGNPASYYHGQLDILTGQMADFPLEHVQEHSPGVWIHNTAHIEPSAQLGSPCYIGAQTRLGSQARIPAGTILGSHSWVDGSLNPGVYGPGALVV